MHQTDCARVWELVSQVDESDSLQSKKNIKWYNTSPDALFIQHIKP